MKNYLKGWMTVMMSLFMVLSIHACKSKTETHVSDKGTVTIDREGEKADITIETKEGDSVKMSINQGNLPDGWPSEIKVLPGGTIIFSQTEAKSNMQQISIETEKSVNDAMDFYKDVLNSGQWSIENTMNIGSMNMLTAKKDDREIMLQVVEEPGESKTHVQIIIK
ncbi:MAG: hypothetical protein AMK71_01810 [Nitrospira bacterium SG8_35_4]|nr:MAG: hypothetical protein AMK71_01810 [Nitrospira bacterium SG8_35_4]